jgi:uncharacterized membrane protein YecN with MAPEG domain
MSGIKINWNPPQGAESVKSIKHVNVGTVGHIDHGRVLMYSGERGYRSALENYPSNVPSIRWYTGTPRPEWIYWLDGLVYVGGRILHDSGIYNVENPSAQVAIDPGYTPMIINPKGKHYYALHDQKAHHLLNEFVAQCDPGYLSATDMVYRRERNKERLVADRKSIVPTRRAIQWAIEMRNWKDKDLFKILGMKQFTPAQLEALRWKRTDA